MHQLLLFSGGILASDSQPTPATVVERDGDGDTYQNGVNAPGYVSAGGVYLGKQVITSSAAILQNVTVVECNATSGAQTNPLPPVSASAGQLLRIIKTDSSGNLPTIAGSGSDKINGASTYTGLATQYAHVTLYADATLGWLIV
jgi:hypothetical protein